MIALYISIFLLVVLAVIYTYYFRLAFARKKPKSSGFSFSGSNDPEHKRRIAEGIKWFDSKEKEDIYIKSYDDLKLHSVYIKSDLSPEKLIIMFHGYRSSFKDFACAFEYYNSLGFGMMVVDQRSHGLSEGKLISYGVKERYDVVSWVEYAKERFGNDVDIYLDGISMGASTVMMASDIVTGVKGIIADCGYTSPKEIIIEVAKSMHVPKLFVHPVGILARIFGGFDYSYSTKTSLAKTNIPVIFVHGLADDFVPSYMTEQNYAACSSNKTIVLVENATHGYSFLVDEKGVKRALECFIAETSK